MIAAPPVALTASPARIELAGAASREIEVVNAGRLPAVVQAGRAGFALDLRGRPRIVARADPAVGLAIRPRRVVVRPGGAATVVVSSVVRPHARPGDHEALVLLATRPGPRGGVSVRMRLGVVVVVRVPGVVVHQLELRALRRRGRLVEVGLRNGGNVVEHLGRGSLRLLLRRGGRLLATVRATEQELLPGARGVVGIRCPPRVHGRVRAVVELRSRPGGTVRRAFRIRLP